MSKPTNKPGWNPTDSSKVVEPTSTKKAQGWAAGEKPAAEHFNWLMKTLSDWIDYVDTAGVKGDKGDTGAQGPQGIQGPQGLQGPAGADGAQGAKGDTGAKGEIGPQGLQGAKGDTGAQGIQGIKGDKGETGAQGAQGPKGDTGPQGLQGAKGDTGAQGIQGLKGDTGAAGAQGLQGVAGEAGAAGADGKTIRYGIGAPNNSLGSDGDFYINTTTTYIYGPKASGVWPAGTSLVGPKGDTGATGPAGSVDSSTVNTINSRLTTLETATNIVTPQAVTINFPYNGGAAPNEYSAGGVLPGSSKTINWTNGASQYLLLDADCNLSFTGAVAGNTYYLRIQQGGYGLKRITAWPANITWRGNSVPTISTAAWTVDVIGVYFDGTNYYGNITQGYFTAPSGVDTKRGYIAGGVTALGSAYAYASQLERINFNSDTTLSVVQSQFGYISNASGTYVYPSVPNGFANNGQGTQSSTAGYRISDIYTNLLSTNSQTTSATFKVPFSNDTSSTIIRLSSTAGIGNNNVRGFDVRGAIIQSSNYAYKVGTDVSGTKAMNKFTFSTDTAARYTYTSSFTPNSNYNGVGFGLSTDTSGVAWMENYSAYGIKIQFSTDTSATLTTTALIGNSFTYSHGGEAVDSQYIGYYIRNTGTNIASLYKGDKSVDTWNIFGLTLSTGAGGAAAVQGVSSGYFCGAAPLYENTSWFVNTAVSSTSNSIKKIAYSPEVFSIHSASLSTARSLGAGFEG